MADEQIIYLGQDDGLTNVRQRLEQIQSRRVIFVVPPQTHLRSHHSWQLLHSDARRMSKDILIISSDRQIRSVAKAAGFKVADSFESRTSSKTRSSSRTGLGTRTATRTKTSPGGGPSEQRTRPAAQPVRPFAPASNRAPQQPAIDDESSQKDETPSGAVNTPASSTFGEPEELYDDSYDYSIAPPTYTPRIVQQPGEEVYDPLTEDIRQAQSIREAAQSRIEDMPTSPAIENVPNPDASHTYGAPPSPLKAQDDDFAHMDDLPPPSLAEQRASVPIPTFGEDVTDIGERPTEVAIDGELEDLGDQPDFLLQPEPSNPPLENEYVEEDDQHAEQVYDVPDSMRFHGARARANRSGKPVEQPLPPQPPIEDKDTRRLIPDQPTRNEPVTTERPSGRLSPDRGSRGIELRPPIQPRPGTARVSQSARQQQARSRIATPPRTSRRPTPAAAAAARRVSMFTAIFLTVLILLCALLGLFAYLAPAATVTVMLPAQRFDVSSIKLTAAPDSKQDVTKHTLPADQLVYSTSADGKGTATGNTKVGTGTATGSVVFTNNGSKSVVIPQGTIISTSGNNSVQFMTTVEPLIQAGQSIPVPIQAVNPGDNSNVSAGSITIIPPDSITKIEQASNVSSVNLNVTNPQATTGGGAHNVVAVSKDDINSLKATIELQLLSKFKTWLAPQLQNGDIQGKIVLNNEKITTSPQEGEQAPNGFTERIQADVTVLVVRKAALQDAANAEFNAAVAKQKHDMSLVTGQSATWPKIDSSTANDGKSLSLSFNASGQIAHTVSEQDVRTVLSGKMLRDLPPGQTVEGVQHYLINLGPGNTLDSTIDINPGFFLWVPFKADRINVQFQPYASQGLPNK